MLDTAVNNERRHARVHEWYPTHLMRTAIEQQRMPRLRHRHDELIHDPARYASVAMFGALTQQRFLHRLERHRAGRLEQRCEGHLERGAARKSRPDRDIRLNPGIKA